jgi:hypothetical protein
MTSFSSHTWECVVLLMMIRLTHNHFTKKADQLEKDMFSVRKEMQFFYV